MSTTKSYSLERVRYYPRQLMTAEDMSAEQEYFVERMRRHNRLFHGWGILCGLEVQPAATADKPWQVRVCPGDACSPTGDEVHLPAPVLFDLSRAPGPDDDDCVPCPCPPGPPMGASASSISVHYLAIRYLCRPARPVRTGHTDCGCGESNCETSRYRDDFELAVLADLPIPYDEKSVKEEEEWLGKLKTTAAGPSLFGTQTRPCGPRSAGPWVILSTVTGDLSHPPQPLKLLKPVDVILVPRALAGPPADSIDAPRASEPSVSSSQPLSSLDLFLNLTLSTQKRRLLPRVQDLLAASRS
jgi:hypothetical protein